MRNLLFYVTSRNRLPQKFHAQPLSVAFFLKKDLHCMALSAYNAQFPIRFGAWPWRIRGGADTHRMSP